MAENVNSSQTTKDMWFWNLYRWFLHMCVSCLGTRYIVLVCKICARVLHVCARGYFVLCVHDILCWENTFLKKRRIKNLWKYFKKWHHLHNHIDRSSRSLLLSIFFIILPKSLCLEIKNSTRQMTKLICQRLTKIIFQRTSNTIWQKNAIIICQKRQICHKQLKRKNMEGNFLQIVQRLCVRFL